MAKAAKKYRAAKYEPVSESIRIKTPTKKLLDKFKLIPRESYDSVIQRLANSHEMLNYKGEAEDD